MTKENVIFAFLRCHWGASGRRQRLALANKGAQLLERGNPHTNFYLDQGGHKQLSNFECFAVYEWWQNPDLSLGMCRKSVFYLRFSAIKPTKVNLLRNLKKQDCTFLLDSFFSIRYYTIWFLFPLQYPFDVYAYFEYPECNMIVSV